MRNVATHDDGAVERKASRNGVLVKFSKNFGHGAIEVNLHRFTLTSLAIFFGDEATGVVIEFFNPDTVFVDFALDVAVGRATHTKTHRARSSVARKANHTNVVGKVFTTKLRTKTNLASFFEQAGFEFYVTESATSFISSSGERIVEVSRSQFHGEHGLLRARSADDDSNVIRRTSCRAERLHLTHEEGHEGVGIEDSLGFLIEITLIGRTTTFGDTKEVIFVAVSSFDVDLRRKVATCVHLIVHSEGRILRIAQVFLSVSFVDTFGNRFFVAETSPDLLSFFGVNDGCARVLADGELSAHCDLSIAEESESHIAVVVGSLRVAKNFCHLLIVRATEEERDIAEGLVHHLGDAFGFYFENGVSLKFTH